MSERLNEYVDMMLHERPASSNTKDGTVFSGMHTHALSLSLSLSFVFKHSYDTHTHTHTGVGGQALILLKLFEATKNSTYLDLAAPYVKDMESKLLVCLSISLSLVSTSNHKTSFSGTRSERFGIWFCGFYVESSRHVVCVSPIRRYDKRLRDGEEET
jgi:hypothetical protein